MSRQQKTKRRICTAARKTASETIRPLECSNDRVAEPLTRAFQGGHFCALIPIPTGDGVPMEDTRAGSTATTEGLGSYRPPTSMKANLEERDTGPQRLRNRRAAGLSTHPITIVFFSFFLSGVVGLLITGQYQARVARREALNSISRLIYSRNTFASLLLSSYARGADDELPSRKAAYDSAFVAWNRSIQASQWTIRESTRSDDFRLVANTIERGLVPRWIALDRALTRAYDLRRRQPNVDIKPFIRQAEAQLKAANMCGYVITGVLWSAADSWLFTPRLGDSRNTLSAGCPTTTDSAATEAVSPIDQP